VLLFVDQTTVSSADETPQQAMWTNPDEPPDECGGVA
jgi:hypothetical protein